MFEYIGVCAALQPQFDIISKPTPFACRKGVSPLTAIDTLIRCTTFARSKWLAAPADWWQTSLHSVAANEPHAAVIGSTLCANELRCQEERTVAPHCRQSAARFTLTLCSGRSPCPLLAARGQRSVRRCTPHAVSIAPPTAPDVGGVQDWFGLSAMSCPLRTSAYGSLTVGYRLASPRRHPTFAAAKPAHPALSVIPIAPCTSIQRRKCLRLRLVARHGRRLRKRIRQSPLQSGIGLLRRADTRLAFHCVCPMLSQACSATPVPSR